MLKLALTKLKSGNKVEDDETVINNDGLVLVSENAYFTP